MGVMLALDVQKSLDDRFSVFVFSLDDASDFDSLKIDGHWTLILVLPPFPLASYHTGEF